MQTISSEDIVRRIRTENPWWEGDHAINSLYGKMKPRAYFDIFYPLVTLQRVRRAVVLMGPRRVGKTVMIYHAVQKLLNEGVPPNQICYFSVDHPIYNGLSLDKLLDYYGKANGVDIKSAPIYAFFDEIQYLHGWEVHLKSLVDKQPNIKAIVSGSSAAALRLKSTESGAGRFTDFLLPPLTFYEYLEIIGSSNLIQVQAPNNPRGPSFLSPDIEKLNDAFIDYLNFGGYPEVIFSPEIRSDPVRFIKSDIIDKVLLRDLPSMYGIQDIPELNRLFTTLAFNTANELSLDELSKDSGVAKNTLKRYIEYLEAAFLIKVVHRVDRGGKRFRRATAFKVYLTNPSMRAALFSPVKADDAAIGNLAETAIFSQWFHATNFLLSYARWADGEVDIVSVEGSNQKPKWAVEVKWSDRPCDDLGELKGPLIFARANGLKEIKVTSKTKTLNCKDSNGTIVEFTPASVYCYTLGYNLIRRRKMEEVARQETEPEIVNPT